MELIVGIDLGTTNSVVAHTNENGIVTVIKGSSSSPILPSVVYFPEGEDDPVVGEQAKRQAVMKPGRVARFFKRGMGEQTFLDTKQDFVVDGVVWRPEALSSLVLKKLKQMAEEYFGQPITKAIITVPAYFGDAERTATRKAGEMAGLEVLRLINEPTAAAIAHGLDKQPTDGHILVFDLGGGTFDVTVLRVGHDKQMTVLGSSGDHRLGGVDFDRLIIDAMADRALAEIGKDIRQDPGDYSDAIEAAEQLKIDLSTLESTSTRLSVGGQRFIFEMTRLQFNFLLEEAGYLGEEGEVREHVENAIEDAGVAKEDIDAIVMVGGSSRIPAFIDLVRGICGKDPIFANMDEDVARGASIVAAMVESEAEEASGLKVPPIKEILGIPMPIDAATHSLGTSVLVPPDYKELANQVMIEKGTPLPAYSEETFYTVQDNQGAIEVELNEGEGSDLKFVKELDKAMGKFPKGPVPKDYPVRAVMKYESDQRITLEAYDGNTGAFLCSLKYEYKQLMSESEVAKKRQEVTNMRIGG